MSAGGSAGAAGAVGVEEWPVSFLRVSSIPWAWSFSRARARLSEVALRARRAEPSATAGAWACEESDQWRVERTSLCGFVGDGGTSLCVHGLCNRVQI